MTVTTGYRPLREFTTLRDAMDRLFEDSFVNPGNWYNLSGNNRYLPIDLYETPEAVGLWVDLPGVDPSAIELSLTGTVLTLRGQRATGGEPQMQGRITERPLGAFLRRIELPAEVVADAVQAEAHLGVLHVRLPKVQPVRPRTIPIQTS